MSVPVDVTDQFRAKGCDINAEDRVYQLGGDFVKVRTLHDHAASGHGHEVFRVSGSIVDEATGKALLRVSGNPSVYDQGEHLTVMNDTPVNLVHEIEKIRFVCVERTLTAHDHYNQSKGLTGVGVKLLPPPRLHVTRMLDFKGE